MATAEAQANQENSTVEKKRGFSSNFRAAGAYVGRAYRLAKPYWQSSKYGPLAWVLLIAILTITFSRNLVIGRISYATADVINILEQRDFENVWNALIVWLVATAIFVGLSLITVYVKDQLIIRWREFITHRFIGRYLGNDVYHQMELKDYNVDNPDQRIAQDAHLVVERTLEFGLRAFSSIVMAFVFGKILWDVSGPLEFTFNGADIYIPGYMLWVAIIYSVFVIYGTHKLGKSLIPLNVERQKREADFRYDFVRLRENSESIALLHGEENESVRLKDRFHSVRKNWFSILKYKMRITAFTDALGQFSTFFPYLAAMPALMSGNVAIGSFLQLRGAFLRVEAQLVFFAAAYEQLAQWKSSADRILDLEDGLTVAKADKDDSKISHQTHENQSFTVENMTLKLPSGEILLNDTSFALEPGTDIVVTGASGSGKSTLFRALSGLWVWGEGVVRRPDNKLMFLPQKPYLPNATLREALIYPKLPENIDDQRLAAIMKGCLLEKFVDRIDECDDWARILSGGEQQRLSIVRAILEQPDWLFLDESTSAMDPITEGKLYQVLKAELPDTTLISIAHRKSLKAYHDQEIRLDPSDQSLEFINLKVSS